MAVRTEEQAQRDAEEKACDELLAATSNIMFMVLGGRGYHASPLDFVRDPTRCLRDMTKWEAASSRGMAPSEGRPT